MSKSNWTEQDIPNQHGVTVVITGASSGLGKEATRVLASKNATVIMAVRNIQKGELVASEIREEHPNADLRVEELNLGNLTSIKSFCATISQNYRNIDILINNAGVMMCPYSKTNDGFEIQMGTNHFGHFALTGLMMPLLEKSFRSRIIVTSSVAHRQGKIDFEDINWECREYKSAKAYADSKLANLYFAYELSRKLEKRSNAPMVLAAHPGYTSTDLQRHSRFWRVMNPLMAQKVDQGVLPTLRAAFDNDAKSGEYYGPSGFLEMTGNPKIIKSNAVSQDEMSAKLLWHLSEDLTGIKF